MKEIQKKELARKIAEDNLMVNFIAEIKYYSVDGLAKEGLTDWRSSKRKYALVTVDP